MTSYATIAEADVYNGGDPLWDALTDLEKQAALDAGTIYLDLYYTCVFYNSEGEVVYRGCPGVGQCAGQTDIIIGDDLKEANSKLALEHITTPLYTVQPEVSRTKSKSFSGGGISHSRDSGTVNKKITDPFPEVSFLLSKTCRLKASKAIMTGTIIRK